MNETKQLTCELCGDLFTPDGRRTKRCGKDHYRSCAVCGTEFFMKPLFLVSKTYCSRKCSAASRKKEPEPRPCTICGKLFTHSNLTVKTCSKECMLTLRAQSFSENNKDRECELCGELFAPTNTTQKYCLNTHYKNCTVCGQSYAMRDVWDNTKTCSTKCAVTFINTEEAKAKARATNLRKYGNESVQATEEHKEKVRQSNLKKYGVENAMMLPEVQEKKKKTNLERYGVEHTLQSPEVRKKIEETCMERYGAPNPWASKHIAEKIRKTVLERYGVEWVNQSEEIKQKRYDTNMEKYGVPSPMMLPDSEFVKKAQATFAETLKNGNVKHRRVSVINQNFAKMVEDNCQNVDNIDFEASFGKFSADLSINDKKILIDINPTISHNVYKSFGCVIGGCNDDCAKHKIMDKKYHYNRAIEAKKNGISLVQVFDWDDEESIVKMINAKTSKNVMKLSARKLICEKIKQSEANHFLRESHIQGGTKGQSHCYGLFEDTEDKQLLAVATFGANRFNKNYEYEFIRYAVREGYIIHGGSGKLFKKFVEDAMPSSVLSYVDFSHTTNETFLPSLGFKEISPTGPSLNYYSVKDKKRFSNSSLLKVGADTLLGTDYGTKEDSGLNNNDIMLLEGFLPIYTAGNRVFVWEQE